MGNSGRIDPNDEQQARSWKLGDAHYGLYLEQGKGVRQNQEGTVRYFLTCLKNGRGVRQNYEEAARCFKLSFPVCDYLVSVCITRCQW